METITIINEFFDRLVSEKKDLNMNPKDSKLSEGYEIGKQEEIVDIKGKMDKNAPITVFFGKFRVYYIEQQEKYRKRIKELLEAKAKNDDSDEKLSDEIDFEQGKITAKIDVLNEVKSFLGSLNSEIAKDELLNRGILEPIIADNLKRVEEEKED